MQESNSYGAIMKYKEQNELDKKINFEEIEDRCTRFWAENGVYKYNPNTPRGKTYMIDTPPPTVSGSLHIGHIFSYTQTDVIARYKRMRGNNLFFPIGWDDNGLPTERRVQNYYNIACNPNVPYDPNFKPVHIPDDKSPRVEVSRKNFIEACQILTQEDEKVFEQIFKKIGNSYDWGLQYSTISSNAIAISQKSFLDLVSIGKARSIEAPTMWDITFQSAVAQAEIEDREMKGYFHNVEFKVEGTDETFLIATTRPVLLPACIAIVAHPDDERYKKFFGKNAIAPLFDIPVPIIASQNAEMDKGTGIMMVCTFGDITDVQWWKQSGLPIKQIIGKDGKILNIKYGEGNFITLNKEKANRNFKQIIGLTIKDAQDKIVEMLKEDGSLKGDLKEVVHPVKFYEKGSVPLEFVSSRQWFVNLMDEKERMLEAGNEIDWYPAHMHSRYDNWTNGLNQDWCISRQRFFGVPFPVWYPIDATGCVNYDKPIFARLEDLPIDPMTDVPVGYTEEQRGKKNGFIGDKDVMDTWATSSLTPQIAMNCASDSSNLSLPFDVRPQSHDIIRTWAFYTIAKSLLHENKIPWKQCFISGFIMDPDRKKMSKSKGNVITPMNLIVKYSSDAVRYWAARAKLGADAIFEEQIMEQGKKLVTKIFNASKFVLNIVKNSEIDVTQDYKAQITNATDKSWMKQLSDAVKSATKSFEQNDYAQALDTIEKSFWDFCNNYLEIVKGRAYNSEDNSAVCSLMFTLDIFVKLFAPFCPFVTEEIYQACKWTNGTTIHLEQWPVAEDFANITDDNGNLYNALSFISGEIRREKTNANISLKTPVIKITICAPSETLDIIKQGAKDLLNVGNILEAGLNYVIADTLSVTGIVLGQPEQ